ncbi:large ribosomal subunit protein mL54 [Osmerus eperlanus]|uniref:large ribosomal subunit protein mL54 n=1 Tax=Osmerus eperlanus TaxID=29151 RepID=UPI002E10CAAC
MSGLHLIRSATRLKCLTSNSQTGLCINNLLYRIPTCGYAKKVAGKGKGKGQLKEAVKGPEVCKDPVKLTSHAMGVNIFKTGDDPQLRPPQDYPEWLFQLDLGPPKKLVELEPDSWEYIKVLRKEHMWRFNRLNKGKRL